MQIKIYVIYLLQDSHLTTYTYTIQRHARQSHKSSHVVFTGFKSLLRANLPYTIAFLRLWTDEQI